ncbi:hypothetical protein HDU98_003367 [Podochytrium sp. JEL0797]|nr:hypothetical protein HDU98_003367 [Podochytrium sp. JEL0797]
MSSPTVSNRQITPPFRTHSPLGATVPQLASLVAVPGSDGSAALTLLGLSGTEASSLSSSSEEEGRFSLSASSEDDDDFYAAEWRAFMALAESARLTLAENEAYHGEHDALSLVAATAAGMERMERRRSSSGSQSIRTPKFLQHTTDDTIMDALLFSHAQADDDTEFPDVTPTTTTPTVGASLDWLKVFQEVEDQSGAESEDLEPISASPIPRKLKLKHDFHRDALGVKKHSSKYGMRLVRPYVCTIGTCRKSYTKRRGLMSHGKMVHPESVDLLKLVEPRFNALQHEEEGGAPLWSEDDEGDYVDIESDFADSDYGDTAETEFGKRKRLPLPPPPPPNVGSDTESMQAIKAMNKKRGRRLSASDFASDSGGEGMLSAEAAKELSARIAFLNEQKPFICTHKGCSKRYRNANGLKYHLDKGHLLGLSISDTASVTSEGSSTSSLVHNTAGLKLGHHHHHHHSGGGPSHLSDYINLEDDGIVEESNDDVGAEGEILRDEAMEGGGGEPYDAVAGMRPFVCPHPGCGKAYKNKNGLRKLIFLFLYPINSFL